ncbi:MAG TPA: AMP-binding protein, partial [Candidatus Binatia bacterium]|nr:AMP-binding protein [Candidatus Binatia bacterium]
MDNDDKDRASNVFVPFPRDALERSIGARFDEIARRFPDKLAVRTKNCSWNYAELSSRADSIGQRINTLDISGAAPILLLCRHDAPAIAGLLGILKAGHFYCALDPSAELD